MMKLSSLLSPFFLGLVIIMTTGPATICLGESTGPLELTVSNVEEEIEGTKTKAVFIYFYDSTCEDCVDVSVEWNALAEEWEGHEVGVIAQVDCSDEEALPICQHFQIEYIPSFFYGGSLNWEPYHGSIDYESLSTFAKNHISKPICSVFRVESCNDVELAKINRLKAMSEEDFDQVVLTAQAELQQSMEEFDAARTPMMERQEKAVQEYQQVVERILRDHNYKFLYEILRKRALEEAEEEEEE